MASINTDILADTPIRMAKELAEQECISEALNNLDRLITLHQHKLNALKNVKKSLLEKMFV